MEKALNSAVLATTTTKWHRRRSILGATLISTGMVMLLCDMFFFVPEWQKIPDSLVWGMILLGLAWLVVGSGKLTGAWRLDARLDTLMEAGIIALIGGTYVLQAFNVPSGSMIPTLEIGNRFFANKLVYGIPLPFSDEKILAWRNPQRGDVVVFSSPFGDGSTFVKRVVGLPGDKLELTDNKLKVNGIESDRWGVYKGESADPALASGVWTVPEGRYFVMGDNRNESKDSRFFGAICLGRIKGEAMFVYWPFDVAGNLL